MFRQLLSIAHVPEDWKQAVITPVHKKSPTNIFTNYRPISDSCVSCKLLERIVIKKIYTHINDNHILCDDQHGFMHGRSTFSNVSMM